MNPRHGKISICGKRELDQFATAGVTHILAIEDPEVVKKVPTWFTGIYYRIQFHDFAEKSADPNAVLPAKKHVKEILRFGNAAIDPHALQVPHLLVHCAAGISRSPTAAFAIIAQALGPGHAIEALNEVRSIRPECFPNPLMVKYADELLGSKGEMIRALAMPEVETKPLTSEEAYPRSVSGV